MSVLFRLLASGRRAVVHVGTQCSDDKRMERLSRTCIVCPDYAQFIVNSVNDPCWEGFAIPTSLMSDYNESLMQDAVLARCVFEESLVLYIASTGAPDVYDEIESASHSFAQLTQGARNVSVTDEWMSELSLRGLTTVLVVDDGNGVDCKCPSESEYERFCECVGDVASWIKGTEWYSQNEDRLEWREESFGLRMRDE